MGTKRHMAMSIRGSLARTDGELDGMIIDDHGYEFNAATIRKILIEHQSRGYEVWTGCDNIDEKGHCLGHEE